MSKRSMRKLKESYAGNKEELRIIEEIERGQEKIKKSFAQKCGVCGEKPVNHFVSLTDFDYSEIKAKHPKLDILKIPQASLSVCCECVDDYIKSPFIKKDFMENMSLQKEAIENPKSIEEIVKYVEQQRKKDEIYKYAEKMSDEDNNDGKQ